MCVCVNGRPLIGNWQRGKEEGKRESELQWTISNEREREKERRGKETLVIGVQCSGLTSSIDSGGGDSNSLCIVFCTALSVQQTLTVIEDR